MVDRDSIVWKAAMLGVGAGAGVVAEHTLGLVWRALSGDVPPKDAADRRTPLPEALVWAASVGFAAGTVRVLLSRAAARAWEARTGSPPPSGERGKGAQHVVA